MTSLRDTWLALYRLMLVTRESDHVIGEVDGHWHPSLGEEAVVAGCYHGLRDDDTLVPHYRGMVVAAYSRCTRPCRRPWPAPVPARDRR
ncbi:MAG: hypothetical protein JSW68_09950 [Burkholderiales bacterium]|nr:MAG: hypothetical protein JSW68_09950 [Burkholderiales bacterium]